MVEPLSTPMSVEYLILQQLPTFVASVSCEAFEYQEQQSIYKLSFVCLQYIVVSKENILRSQSGLTIFKPIFHFQHPVWLDSHGSLIRGRNLRISPGGARKHWAISRYPRRWHSYDGEVGGRTAAVQIAALRRKELLCSFLLCFQAGV